LWNGQRAADPVGYAEGLAAVRADPARGPVLDRLVQYAGAASGATSVAVEASLQLAHAAVELLA